MEVRESWERDLVFSFFKSSPGGRSTCRSDWFSRRSRCGVYLGTAPSPRFESRYLEQKGEGERERKRERNYSLKGAFWLPIPTRLYINYIYFPVTLDRLTSQQEDCSESQQKHYMRTLHRSIDLGSVHKGGSSWNVVLFSPIRDTCGPEQ